MPPPSPSSPSPSRFSTRSPPFNHPSPRLPPKKIRGRDRTRSLSPGSQTFPLTPLPPHRHPQTSRSHQPVHHRRPRLRYRTRCPEYHVIQRWPQATSPRRHTQRRNRITRDESNKRRRRCIDDHVTRQIIRCHRHISRLEQSTRIIAEEKPSDGVHRGPGKIEGHRGRPDLRRKPFVRQRPDGNQAATRRCGYRNPTHVEAVWGGH